MILAVLLMYVLHQDFWFWRATEPIVFGFLPVGLFYHACFTLACSGLMWLLVKHAWPAYLEADESGVYDSRSVEANGEQPTSSDEEGASR